MNIAPNAKTASCQADSGCCDVCGDSAVIGRIVAIGEARTASVALADGTMATVALDLVDARIGDDVLVHIGFAIGRIGQ